MSFKPSGKILKNGLAEYRIGSLVAVLLFFSLGSAAQAMPPFAQSYGMKCNVCHTQVPALNSYGRYLQRTGYGSLDAHTLHRSTPFWIGETANYSHNSQDSSPPRTEFGNLALHAAGAFDQNTTFHLQQWIVQNGQPGGIDTAWITFNNLFHRDGHLYVGKMPGTTASPLSQWFDIAPFATPELTVGEHVYQNDGNRWGAKFTYVKNSLDAEVGYFAAGGDLGGAGVYSQDIEKTLQWRIAHASPTQPLEYGVMGARGSLPLTEGGFDQYTSVTPYVQRDPVGKLPGIFAMYQMGYDANAGQDGLGNPLGPARSNAATVELYQPIGDKALVSVRKEFQNDGLGTQSQSGNIDFAYHLAPYLHLYLETAMARNATPTWSYSVWWTLPLQKVASADSQSPAQNAASPTASPPTTGSATPSATPLVTQHPIINVTASNWKFSPDAITLRVGETTRLRLNSTQGVHGIESRDLGIPLTPIEPGKSVTINVTPKKTGTYVLHCAIVCGPGHEKMVLNVVVTGGNAPPAISAPGVQSAPKVQTVSVTASNWKFFPAEITMHVGQTTHMRLTSTQGVHGIQSSELGIPLTPIEPGKIVTLNVTPKNAGTYTLHCAIVCGPGHEKMLLTVIVLKSDN